MLLGPAARVVVAGHDHDSPLAAREVPEARHRHAVGAHLRDQVRQQPLLFVRLRDRDLVEVDPVGEEQVVRADRRDLTVALLTCPRGVPLTRLHDRAGQVVGERRCLTAGRAHAPQRHRRAGRRGRRAAVQVGHLGGARKRPAVGAVVELHGVAGDARTGAGGRVDPDVSVVEIARVGAQPKHARERGTRPHRDEVAPALHPVRQGRCLRRRHGARRENHDAVAAQGGGRDLADVPHLERVQALRGEDLGVVLAEAVRLIRDHENRTARDPDPAGKRRPMPAVPPMAAAARRASASVAMRRVSCHLLLGASTRIGVRVVSVFAARSRAVATAVTRNEPRRSSRARARRVRRSSNGAAAAASSSQRLPPRDVGPGTAEPESDTTDHLAWRAAHAQPDQPATRGAHAARADPHPRRPHDLGHGRPSGRWRHTRRRRSPTCRRQTSTRAGPGLPALQVSAVVGGAAANGDLTACGRRPGVAPALPAGGRDASSHRRRRTPRRRRPARRRRRRRCR